MIRDYLSRILWYFENRNAEITFDMPYDTPEEESTCQHYRARGLDLNSINIFWAMPRSYSDMRICNGANPKIDG